MSAYNRNLRGLIKGILFTVVMIFAIELFMVNAKAEEVTTIIMKYEDKVFTRQLYDIDTNRIKEGVVTEGLKSVGEQCDNLNFQLNGQVDVNKNAVMDAVKMAIIAGQKTINIDLSMYTSQALASNAGAVANGASALVNAVNSTGTGTVTAQAAATAAMVGNLITNEALNAIGIDCKISEATTMFNARQDRAVNIRTAASKINGLILQPGQGFSANLMFGPRTVANGYGLGNVISGGKYVKAVGGGICQVSSTLNLAVLRAGMIPTERHNHSHRSSYIGSGLDATISAGTLDYQFVNTLAYPVFIAANADGGVLTIALYSNHDALCGIHFEPNVVGGSLSNTTYLVGVANGAQVVNIKAYSSKYAQ